MADRPKLTIVGGGRMGAALLGGLLSSGWAQPEELCVVEPVARRRDELAALHPGVRLAEAAVRSDGVVVV
ncbi:MAG: NAD(P)-binding domain-containing protein, partial [Actinomycetota bacterium]|nr:NAD(P)-binding domain-containing protein [Actinomycetota bacterium]